MHFVSLDGATGADDVDNPRNAAELAFEIPVLNGFEVVAALQEDAGWRDIPVIVITSLDLNAKDRERLNSGVQSVLVKDKFRPEDLVERIRRLVQSRPTATNQMEAAL